MVQVELAVFLALIGAAFGSFVDAFTWRLHTKRNWVTGRSECEHCHHQLSVPDLVPIISWLVLRGKCRYCGAKITPIAPFTEAGVAVLFVMSYLWWPLGFAAWQAVALFVLWLLYVVLLAALLVYDLRWMILPDAIVLPLCVAAFVDAGLRVSLLPGVDLVSYFMYVGAGVAALAGVYGALYVVSKGKWVGFGDVKLSVFIGATLGWQKALLVLGLSNVIGFAIVLPGLLTGRLTRQSRVPFGPFLIVAFLLAGLWGDALIHWYLTFVGL